MLCAAGIDAPRGEVWAKSPLHRYIRQAPPRSVVLGGAWRGMLSCYERGWLGLALALDHDPLFLLEGYWG